MKYNIYDFDGTIFDGESGSTFYLFCCKKYPFLYFKIILIGLYALLYLFRIKTLEELKSFIFSYVPKIKDKDKLLKEFWDENRHKMMSHWTEKKDHSHDIVMTASSYLWIEPIMKEYNIYDLLATGLDEKTGKITTKNCHDVEKIRVLREKYPDIKIENAYTDSIRSDWPMIKEAKHAFIVKKCKLIKYEDYKPPLTKKLLAKASEFYKNHEEIMDYLIVGGLTTLVSIVVKMAILFTDLSGIGIDKILQTHLSVLISWTCAVLFAYVANRKIVFKSHEKNIPKEMIKFFGARLINLPMDDGIMLFFQIILGLNTKSWQLIAILVSQIIIIVFNYIVSKMFVFKKRA